ncbi:MAG: endonuclease/exonuclease/phosphatase family protein [Candidatus Binatia bacterium]
MSFRVATLNLEQDHKRWEKRRELIVQQLNRLRPDVFALNEISIPLQTAQWLQQVARERLGIGYILNQQSKVNAASQLEAEGILTRLSVIETANLDYRAGDSVAQVVRLEFDGRYIDLYVTHLYKSRGADSLRQYQVERLLDWIHRRDDAAASIVCGDFNATLDMHSMQLMSRNFRPTQTRPTAFTPLRGVDGVPSHPYWERLDRCIDYIWITESLTARASGLCFDEPASDDSTLWPSDHVGVWADLEFVDSVDTPV